MNWTVMAALMNHSRLAIARHYARRAGGLDWFGADAAGYRLDAALADAELHFRTVEGEAWRDYHGAIVRSASSLALGLFEHEKLDLDEAVLGLGPDGDWPNWLVGPGFAGSARKARRLGRKVPRNLHAMDDRERFLHAGLVLRRWADPDGALGIRLSKHGLEVGARFGGLSLRTTGDVAVVVVEADVPHTARAGMIGRQFRALIDHPALRDPSYLVEEVGDLERERSPAQGAWRMVVRVPRRAWRLPWSRGGGS